MAKVKRNTVVRGISGAIGGMVFRQMPNGETWVSTTYDFSNRRFSKSQKEHQSRFQQAAAYARDAARKYPIYVGLAKGTVKSPYNWALSDWFNPPVIHCIERRKGQIWVNASDNVMVTKVQVTILDEVGEIRERGEGIKRDENWWEYTSSAEGRIVAEAWDLAGNAVRKDD
jgi:hypothetical protein